MDSSLEYLFRIILAAILGALIGYERQFKHKSAGLRTNVLVCIGSCLVMIISNLIYAQVEGKTNADPARLAAQVVSGIGFLGAGAIIKEGVTVIGLTTAACIWVVSGVGLAVGGGYYSVAIFSAILVYLILQALSHMDTWRWMMPADNIVLKVQIANTSSSINGVYSKLNELGLKTKNLYIEFPNDDVAELNIILYNPQKIKLAEISTSLNNVSGIKSLEVH